MKCGIWTWKNALPCINASAVTVWVQQALAGLALNGRQLPPVAVAGAGAKPGRSLRARSRFLQWLTSCQRPVPVWDILGYSFRIGS